MIIMCLKVFVFPPENAAHVQLKFQFSKKNLITLYTLYVNKFIQPSPSQCLKGKLHFHSLEAHNTDTNRTLMSK